MNSFDIPLNQFISGKFSIPSEDLFFSSIPEKPSPEPLLRDDPSRDRYINRTYYKNAAGNNLNASHIQTSSFNCIVAQGPQKIRELNTVHSFFDMVSRSSRNIICVAKPFDEGGIKYFDYFNSSTKKDTAFELDITPYIKSKTRISASVHYFPDWPDMSIPADNKKFICFFKHCLQISNPIIHCGAGIGRAGVMVTLLSLYKWIENQVNRKSSEEVVINIPEWLIMLRSQRAALVKRYPQFVFCYEMLRMLLLNWPTIVLMENEAETGQKK